MDKVRNGRSQLNRWSRARVIRSGHKLDRPGQPKHEPNSTREEVFVTGLHISSSSSSSEDDKREEVVKGKEIYMVSDGSGRTAEHSVNAALGQFEHFLIHGRSPVYTRLFSGVILFYMSIKHYKTGIFLKMSILTIF